MRRLGLAIAVWLALWGLAPAAMAGQDQPATPADQDQVAIFDAHLHYNRDQWSIYSVDDILALMDQAGIRKAFVSSTPDDGTLALYQRAPDRIVPGLRPYRVPADQFSWTRDPSIVDYVQAELVSAPYRGIGEFHLLADEAQLEVPRALADLGAAQHLVLHAHADAVAIEQLVQQRPDSIVVWAHAGMTTPPETVARLLERYPNLWVELALRYDVALRSGQLDPAWAAVFERYPDRFMLGTDTWVVSQWTNLVPLTNRVRDWLRQLPPEVAQALAFGNAERLFNP